MVEAAKLMGKPGALVTPETQARLAESIRAMEPFMGAHLAEAAAMFRPLAESAAEMARAIQQPAIDMLAGIKVDWLRAGAGQEDGDGR